MANLMPVIDDEEESDEFDFNPDIERDRYHDSQIGNVFLLLQNPNATMDDFFDERGRDRTQMEQNWTATRYMTGTLGSSARGENRIIEVKPIESDESAVAPATAPAEERRFAQPNLVQDARVTSDLFRVKTTYETDAQAPAETAPIASAPQIEEENEDFIPTAATRQYATGGDAVGDVARADVDGDEDGRVKIATEERSFAATKREKTLVAVVVGVVLALVVLIIVNAAILMGLNSSAAATDAEYEESVNALIEAQSRYEEMESDILDNLDVYADMLGMTPSN